jgi:predicted metalloprotease with PDZ domain
MSREEFASILDQKQHLDLFKGVTQSKISLIEASQAFFKDFEKRNLCYGKGLLLALKLDSLLNSTSNGQKSLLGLMTYFLNEFQSGSKIGNYASFHHALEKYSEGVFQKIRPYIEDGQDVDVGESLRSLGGSYKTVYRYILGAERKKEFPPLCLIAPPKRLMNFGIQDGDCITHVNSKELKSLDQLYSYHDKKVPITLLRSGKTIQTSVQLMKLEEHNWSFRNESKWIFP